MLISAKSARLALKIVDKQSHCCREREALLHSLQDPTIASVRTAIPGHGDGGCGARGRGRRACRSAVMPVRSPRPRCASACTHVSAYSGCPQALVRRHSFLPPLSPAAYLATASPTSPRCRCRCERAFSFFFLSNVPLSLPCALLFESRPLAPLDPSPGPNALLARASRIADSP